MKIPKLLASLVCLVAIAAAFVLSGTTWIEIGRKSGYGALSWVLICAFDAYIVTALIAWWAPSSARSEAFARRSVYGMTLASSVTQGIYHSAAVLALHEPAWQAGLALLVGLAIPIVAALTVHSLTLSQAGVLDAARNLPVQPDEALADLAPSAPQTQHTAVPQATPAPQPAATEAPSLQPARAAAPAPQRRSAPANPRGTGVDITIEDVRAGLAAGKSPKQIATQYDCHVATVHRRMRLIPKQRAQSLMRVAR